MKKRKEFREDEWMKKMWYIYTMEDYSAIKRNVIESFVETVIENEVRKTHINTGTLRRSSSNSRTPRHTHAHMCARTHTHTPSP